MAENYMETFSLNTLNNQKKVVKIFIRLVRKIIEFSSFFVFQSLTCHKIPKRAKKTYQRHNKVFFDLPSTGREPKRNVPRWNNRANPLKRNSSSSSTCSSVFLVLSLVHHPSTEPGYLRFYSQPLDIHL